MKLASTLILVSTLLATSVLNAAESTPSKELAARGRRVWAIFECCALASVAEEKDLRERLFQYGYSEGRAFLKAIEDGKVSRADLSREVPVGLLLLLQGPSVDFILGRIYAGAEENALDKIYRGDVAGNSDLAKALAKEELHKRNCELLTPTSQEKH
jgi:hypothetical protein